MEEKPYYYHYKGLPGDCYRETYDACRKIFLKYRALKKNHMSRDRIAGVMLTAVQDAWKKVVESERPARGKNG